MDNRKKSLLVVAVALLSGMVIGGAATATFIRHNIDVILARSPLEARGDFVRGLAARLELNATQRDLAQARLGEMHAQAQQLHEQTQARLRELFARFAAELSPALNETQRQELSRLALELGSQQPPPPPLLPWR